MSDVTDYRPLPDPALEYIDRVVGQMNCRRGLREDVRRELTAHFEDALRYSGGSTDAREAALANLIAEFGDGALLAELLRRAKKRCDPGAGFRLAGLMLVAVVVLGYIVMGAPLLVFINIPGALIAIFVPLALSVAAFGIVPLSRALRTTVALVWNLDPESVPHDAPSILRRLAAYTYASIGWGVLMGVIEAAHLLHDPSRLGPALAVVLLAPLYAVLFAEGFYRPAAVRAEFLLSLHVSHLHAAGTDNQHVTEE